MTYRVAICDDNPHDTNYVLSILNNWAQNRTAEVSVESFQSAESFLFHYEDDKNYDILLLDIEMGSMDGVTLAREIRCDNERVQIVFITGYPDYIAQGYDVSALHYLMKPVSHEKLGQVLDRAAAALCKQVRTVLLPVGRESVRLSVDDILYAESQAHYMMIRTAREEYKCRMTLPELKTLLGEGFARCHRSYLVGLCHISRITKTDVHLRGGILLPLAKGMYDELNLELIRYLRVN